MMAYIGLLEVHCIVIDSSVANTCTWFEQNKSVLFAMELLFCWLYVN